MYRKIQRRDEAQAGTVLLCGRNPSRKVDCRKARKARLAPRSPQRQAFVAGRKVVGPAGAFERNYFSGSMIAWVSVILPSSCGSAEERLTWTVKEPASACQAAAFSSNQVKARASSGTVTWRGWAGARNTPAKPFCRCRGRGTCG